MQECHSLLSLTYFVETRVYWTLFKIRNISNTDLFSLELDNQCSKYLDKLSDFQANSTKAEPKINAHKAINVVFYDFPVCF